MKRASVLLSFIVVGVFAVTTTHAHILQTDGSIGAVLHSTPDDEPVAGQPSDFFFELKDKTGQFNPAQCVCQVVVQRGTETIHSQSLFSEATDPATTSAHFTFTFPATDLYQIHLTGAPQPSGTFAPFALEYTVRVAQIATASVALKPSSSSWVAHHSVHIIGTIVLTLIMSVVILKERRAQKS